jgi:hypothetical protein
MRFLRLFVAFGLLAGGFAAAGAARAEGAFAFSQFGIGGWASGISSDAKTRAQADQQALMNCNSRAPGCTIKWRFTKSCFAYAVQAAGNGWGVGEAADLLGAQQSALENCNRNGQFCTIRGTYCDTISEDEEKQKFSVFQTNWQRCFKGDATDDDLQDGVTACQEALNYDRVVPVDREKLLARKNIIDGVIRARLQQKQNSQREEEQQEVNRGACLSYDAAACMRALKSPLTAAVDRTWIRQQWLVSARFGLLSYYCREGSAVSCDLAAASPAATAAAKASLQGVRDGLPFYQKLWAAAYAYLPVPVQQWAMAVRAGNDSWSISAVRRRLDGVPNSTLIASLVAAALGLCLAGVLVGQKMNLQNVQTVRAADSAGSAASSRTAPAASQSVDRAPPPINTNIVSGRKMDNSPTPSTAYVLNILLPGAGNIYFGQPIVGCLFILSILFGIFIFMFGASAAVLGIVIILASVLAAFFTFGLSLIVGLPVGLLFLLMGAGPVLAFLIWLFALIVGELLIHSKVRKMAGQAQAAG